MTSFSIERTATWCGCLGAGLIMAGCIAQLASPGGADVPEPCDTCPQPLPLIDGVYAVEEGGSLIGDTSVVQLRDGRLTLHANSDVIVGELTLQRTTPSTDFEGASTTVRSGRHARARLSVVDAGAGVPVRISGSLDGEWSLVLRRMRAIEAPPFYIIAHRGGGRNSDRLRRSENSIEMVKYASVLGANAVEIDVKRTRDDQLIVFHDETFSPRTVQGSVLLGPVRAFTLHEIQRYGRLHYGERIPTLDELLRAVVDETPLELVWLDVKDAEATDAILAAQQRALDHARSIGREVRILFGIPSDEVLGAYRRSALRDATPVLCELSPETVRTLPSCEVWAPRWTVEFSDDQIDAMHATGIDVVTWTIDVREYMLQYLTDRKVDGILTNYPSLLCGMYYSMAR